MQTSPSQLRELANTLRREADQLDDAAATLDSALPILSTRTNPGQIAESAIGTRPTESNPIGNQPREIVIPWGKKAAALDDGFIDGLFWIQDEIKLDPVLLVPCMHFESKLDPKARNPASSASGLIQFMSATAISLGTTIEKIRAMGPMEQLGFVHNYFKKIKRDWTGATLCDVYLAILWPKGIGLPESANIFVKGTQTYAVNAGLDKNKDGYVTKSEICARLYKEAQEGMGENALYLTRP
jgi:hypothetical protein